MQLSFFSTARVVLLLMSFSVASCGGGSDTVLPTPDSSTSPQFVSSEVPVRGGTLQISGQDAISVTNGTLSRAATFAVSRVPSADPKAAASTDISLTLPLGAVLASPTAEVILYVYPSDIKVPQAIGRASIKALLAPLDPETLVAQIKVHGTNTYVRIAQTGWDAARGAYTITLDSAILAELAVEAIGNATLSAANVAVNATVALYQAAAFKNLDTSTQLWRWSENDIKIAQRGDREANLIPLVLVHGIKGPDISFSKLGVDVCGQNDQYISAWTKFKEYFYEDKTSEKFKNINFSEIDLKDKNLKNKYALYTFQYPTNIGIEQNSKQFASAIAAQFQNIPIVVLSHSMGGLVTRAADLYSQQGRSGWANNININRVITLDTPHLGTPWISHTAQRIQMACLGDAKSQGAKDLDWSRATNSEPCSNSLLCGEFGLNNSMQNLSKYVPYSAKFDFPRSTQFDLFPNLPWPNIINAYQWATYFLDHRVYGLPRITQTLGQELKKPLTGVDSTSSGDGMVLVSSQRLQQWKNGAWEDQVSFYRLPATYLNLDHTSVHDDSRVFAQEADGKDGGIWKDLLLFRQDINDTYGIPIAPTSISPGSISTPGPVLANTQVAFKWAPVRGITHYRLQIEDSNNGQKVFDDSVIEPLQTITLPSATQFRWTVTACNLNGCSQVPAWLYFVTPTTSPIIVQSASCSAPVVGSVMICSLTGINLPVDVSMAATNCSPSTMAIVSGGTVSIRQFSCTPDILNLPVSVTYKVPGIIGTPIAIPVVLAGMYATFYDTFDGDTLDPTKWNFHPNPTYGGSYAIIGSEVTFNKSWADTLNKVTFTGSKIVIEARIAGKDRLRDTTFYLYDVADSSNLISAHDTNYNGWGLTIQTTGAFGSINETNNLSFSSYKVIRLTIDGNQISLERGDSSGVMTEGIQRTMSTSIVGKSFYLLIGTGAPDYTPGSFDWISVTTY